MGFFNSLSIRLPLAFIGGMLYALLTYCLGLVLRFPPHMAIGTGGFVFLLYLGSRVLILFSGIDTLYYSKARKESSYTNTTFGQTAQWVGKFYHYHDVVLFTFLSLVAMGFIISLIMDGIRGKSWGQTVFDFLLPFAPWR